MLVLLLTMRTWWYKEGVGRVAGGTDVDSAEDVPPSDKKRAEGANLHIVARCRVPGARVGRRGSGWSHRPFDRS